MELHPHHLQFEATSSLTPQQLEVFRLYQHCGVEISNEKFQVCFIKLYNNCNTGFNSRPCGS